MTIKYNDLDKLKSNFSRPATLDIETTGLDRYTDTLNMIGVFDGVKEEMAWSVEPHIKNNFKNTSYYDKMFDNFDNHLLSLDLDNTIIVAHNAQFDIKFLKEHTSVEIPYFIDTMIMAYLYDPYDYAYGLKHLVKKIWGIDYDEELDVKTGVSKASFDYNEKDCHFTYLLYNFYRERLTEREMLLAFYLTQVFGVYIDATEYGVNIDQDLLQVVKKETYEYLALTESDIYTTLRHKYGITKKYKLSSPVQMGQLIYKDLGNPIIHYTNKGEPSTGKKALLGIKQKDMSDLLLDYRYLTKKINGFLTPYEELGRLHPQFKVTGTKTGRTSSNKPNLQQVPAPRGDKYGTANGKKHGIKHLLNAPKGYRFVEIDYSQMELRAVSHIANVTNMVNSYKNGEDLHMRTGNLVANDGKTKADRPDSVNDQLRQSAKAVNFGFLYGMGAESFVEYAHDTYGVSVTLDEARVIRRNFFKEYPQLLTYYIDIELEAHNKGYIESPIGRRRRVFKGSRDGDWDRRSFINAKVQGFASDCLLMALLEVSEMAEYGVDFHIVGTVHDAVLFYIKEGKEYLLHDIKHIMEHPQYVDLLIDKPLIVPIEADVDCWYDRWYGEPFDWESVQKPPQKRKLRLGNSVLS